jgi:hypothetical protein
VTFSRSPYARVRGDECVLYFVHPLTVSHVGVCTEVGALQELVVFAEGVLLMQPGLLLESPVLTLRGLTDQLRKWVRGESPPCSHPRIGWRAPVPGLVGL